MAQKARNILEEQEGIWMKWEVQSKKKKQKNNFHPQTKIHVLFFFSKERAFLY